MSDKSLILDVLNNYIKEDSLYGGHISPNLLPYFYYPAQYSDDGHEIPPPPISHEGEHLDESKIAERVGTSRYISKFDADHIKYQLIKSKDISSSFRGMRFSTNIQGKSDIDSGYVLYVPIFNRDSSAAYVQYDFYVDLFNGQGNGAVLVKQNGKWQMIKWLDRWIN